MKSILGVAFLIAISFTLLACSQSVPSSSHTTAQIDAVIENLAEPYQHGAAVKELIASGPAFTPNLIKALADPREDVRAGVAEALRNLTKDPTQLPGYHSRNFWVARIAQLHTGMSMDDTLAILLPDLTPEQRNKTVLDITGGGGGRTSQYRLDDYWIISIFDGVLNWEPLRIGLFSTPPQLWAQVNHIWVKPPDNFTGTWTTWYVNGQKCNAVSYIDGKRDGPDINWDDHGKLLSRWMFKNGEQLKGD